MAELYIYLCCGLIFFGWVIICIKERRVLPPIVKDIDWRRSPPGGYIYNAGLSGFGLLAVLVVVLAINHAGEKLLPGYNHWIPAIILTFAIFILLSHFDGWMVKKIDEEYCQKVREHEESTKRDNDLPTGQ